MPVRTSGVRVRRMLRVSVTRPSGTATRCHPHRCALQQRARPSVAEAGSRHKKLTRTLTADKRMPFSDVPAACSVRTFNHCGIDKPNVSHGRSAHSHSQHAPYARMMMMCNRKRNQQRAGAHVGGLSTVAGSSGQHVECGVVATSCTNQSKNQPTSIDAPTDRPEATRQ